MSRAWILLVLFLCSARRRDASTQAGVGGSWTNLATIRRQSVAVNNFKINLLTCEDFRHCHARRCCLDQSAPILCKQTSESRPSSPLTAVFVRVTLLGFGDFGLRRALPCSVPSANHFTPNCGNHMRKRDPVERPQRSCCCPVT